MHSIVSGPMFARCRVHLFRGMTMIKITDRTIAKLIYLSGIRATGYTVHVSGFDGMQDIPVNSVAVGNALVRSLRDLARAHPDWFPPSKMQEAA
jgi:hypothetical protein